MVLQNYRFFVAGMAILCLSLSVNAQPTGHAAVLPLDALHELAAVYGLIKSDYVSPQDNKKLIDAAISGMVSSLDPHSAYLDQDAFAEQYEDMSGKFFGVGIEAESTNGIIRVITAREGSPAAVAGIKPLDVVLRVNGETIQGLSIDQVGRRMRGEIDTPVTLTVTRTGVDQPLTFKMIRQEVLTQSVKGKIVTPGYGWIRIAEFQERTVEDFVRQFSLLTAQDPKMKGLVLDLRNDPGGLVSSAVGICAAFLPQGTLVVSTRGRSTSSRGMFYASAEYYAMRSGSDPLADLPAMSKTMPLVVLVNAGSASAAEIVAGALQDQGRASIMGTPTFGKGSVQEIRRLSNNTAVKLTIARYYTPGGRSIQAKGITPDLAVGDRQTEFVREANLDNHLARDPGSKSVPALLPLPDPLTTVIPGANSKPPPELGSEEDFPLTQAIRKLQGLSVVLTPSPP